MITWKDAEDRIASGGTLTRKELSEVVLSGGSRTAAESDRIFRACPEWVAEQEARAAAMREKEARYLLEETPLRNAARTLWHQNKGTLGQPDAPRAAGAAAATMPAVATESAAHLSDEENVPF